MGYLEGNAEKKTHILGGIVHNSLYVFYRLVLLLVIFYLFFNYFVW